MTARTSYLHNIQRPGAFCNFAPLGADKIPTRRSRGTRFGRTAAREKRRIAGKYGTAGEYFVRVRIAVVPQAALAPSGGGMAISIRFRAPVFFGFLSAKERQTCRREKKGPPSSSPVHLHPHVFLGYFLLSAKERQTCRREKKRTDFVVAGPFASPRFLWLLSFVDKRK